jgi:preprotein translocase SecE subunit
MYKWPQGRVIRTICLLLLAAIAVDFGCEAWGHLYVWLNPTLETSPVRQLILGCLSGTLGLAVLLGGLVAVGFHHRAVDFLIEVEQEMVRVTWPPTRALINSTIWIAVMIAILALFILAIDTLVYNYVISKFLGGEG